MAEKDSPCIDHGKRGNKYGYGFCSFEGHSARMHRAVYCQANGVTLSDIEGLSVRHTCDNPRCINPNHLVIGTHVQNMEDMKSRKRQAYGERNARAVTTWEQVEQMRAMYVWGSSTHGCTALAKMFGLSESHVSRIVRGEVWKKD